jgi:metal-sulfur cluster biosynthetic enzyme
MATEQAVWAALARVTDPEYPLSIVELGMIYGVTVADGIARITLTFTSIGCPAADMLIEDVTTAVEGVEGVDEVQVEVVWSPPWNADRISARGKQVLAMYGVAA